jgi:NAD(P)H-dependent flavin oxidoreductase YrpB (nitropropane dioxygenase family)
MKSPICDMLGIEFPLLAFSHCRDVVAAVSRAGGFGVLGATAHSPETIEQELKWIDDHVDGKPYGLDVLIPENISTAGEKNVTWKSLEARISPEHRDFTRNLLKKYGIELTTTNVADNQPQPFDAQRALEVLDASFSHPIKLIANALGVPPKTMIDMGKKHDVRWRRWSAPRNMRCARSRPASTFSSSRAPKPAAIAARSRPWCWCRR